jgi:formamidopyrimidine-DNA glycosylase
MPELPEVEVIRRDLERDVLGRRIKEAEVRSTKNAMRAIRKHDRRKDFSDAMEGAKIAKIGRRGKYLLLYLDNDNVLVIHLGMSGQLIYTKTSAPFENHTHVAIQFTVGGQLRFIDPRTFGQMFTVHRTELKELKEFEDLGIDALEEPLTWQYFSQTLDERKTKLKRLLMDQGFISGLGNIYSDEILFAAGIRYDRKSDDLSSQEVRRLYRAIQEILQDAIKFGGTSADDDQYRNLAGELGEYQDHLKVYQQEGKPCRRCRTPIDRTRWSNRSTYYCPQCQV